MRSKFYLWFAILCVFGTPAFAQKPPANPQKNFTIAKDPRGRPEITVCTQNLENYGLLRSVLARDPKADAESLAKKEAALVARFTQAGCDIIAVQELLGSKAEAFQALGVLRTKLKDVSNRFFNAAVGDATDVSRCGFLYAIDKLELLHSVTYEGVELPRLTPTERPRSFPRAPLEIQVKTKEGVSPISKVLSLITFHFKSKRDGWKDPAALDFEIYRMEMSEAIRRIVLARHREMTTNAKNILLLLGDRNSHLDSGSARILEGSVRLSNFRREKQCRLSGRGVPLCTPGSEGPQDFFSVLTMDPETKRRPGTFIYKKIGSWLDDILMPQPALTYARTRYDSIENFASGLVAEPAEASDHALAYVRLNW